MKYHINDTKSKSSIRLNSRSVLYFPRNVKSFDQCNRQSTFLLDLQIANNARGG